MLSFIKKIKSLCHGFHIFVEQNLCKMLQTFLFLSNKSLQNTSNFSVYLSKSNQLTITILVCFGEHLLDLNKMKLDLTFSSLLIDLIGKSKFLSIVWTRLVFIKFSTWIWKIVIVRILIVGILIVVFFINIGILIVVILNEVIFHKCTDFECRHFETFPSLWSQHCCLCLVSKALKQLQTQNQNDKI